MMHGSQNDALKWVRENQKGTHYCNSTMLHWL
jgi:hypothetical protein